MLTARALYCRLDIAFCYGTVYIKYMIIKMFPNKMNVRCVVLSTYWYVAFAFVESSYWLHAKIKWFDVTLVVSISAKRSQVSRQGWFDIHGMRWVNNWPNKVVLTFDVISIWKHKEYMKRKNTSLIICAYILKINYIIEWNFNTTLHTGHISVLKFISVLTRVEYYCLDDNFKVSRDIHDHRNQLLYISS